MEDGGRTIVENCVEMLKTPCKYMGFYLCVEMDRVYTGVNTRREKLPKRIMGKKKLLFDYTKLPVLCIGGQGIDST